MKTREHPDTPLGLVLVLSFTAGVTIGTALFIVPVAAWWAGDWAYHKVVKTRTR